MSFLLEIRKLVEHCKSLVTNHLQPCRAQIGFCATFRAYFEVWEITLI